MNARFVDESKYINLIAIYCWQSYERIKLPVKLFCFSEIL